MPVLVVGKFSESGKDLAIKVGNVNFTGSNCPALPCGAGKNVETLGLFSKFDLDVVTSYVGCLVSTDKLNNTGFDIRLD